jgi:diguanylate cyclase (GGDEF)-like protein/PAS domain S-box-containing protein
MRRLEARSTHPLWLTVALLVLCAGLFSVYVWSEKRVDQANELRQRSFLLVDELRQSSDDLTRMARTYVMTGDARYKLAYQAILDIRDGKRPRPNGYQNVYWDTELFRNTPQSPAGGVAVPLLTLMQQAGFTVQELQKLEQAKANSDQLTTAENAAMDMIDANTDLLAAVRVRASAMLHDQPYHWHKAAIMQPIKEFNAMMDRRTADAVALSLRIAQWLRLVFIAFAASLVMMVWRANTMLRNILGGSAEEVFAQISSVGHGKTEMPMAVSQADKNSVLGWLAKTQESLKKVSMEREQALAQIADKELRLRTIIEAEPECVKVVDAQGRLLEMNAAGLAMIEADSLEEVAGKSVLKLLAPQYRDAFQRMHQRVLGGETLSLTFEIQGLKGGRRWLETHAVPLQHLGEAVQLAVTRDITARKQSDEALRIAATAFESQQGMVVTNAQRVILRVNQAFTRITGYSAKEAIGQYPSMLSSGRQDKPFFAAMSQVLEIEGAWAGEIWNRRKSGETYPEWLNISAVKDEDGVATHYVGIFTDISQRKAVEEQIEALAFFDPLTRLPNRRLLLDRLEQALHTGTRHSRRSALLFVDLDNFKTLNDTLGHHQGDLLLAQVAQRLKACVRDGDTVARLGSDEFVVILETLSEISEEAANQAEAVGEKVLTSLGPRFQLSNGAHHSTASIGITLFGGAQQESHEEPLKRAELAMFQAKSAGRNTLRFYDPQMQAQVSAHAALEDDLREALSAQQLLLHYQAQVVGGGRITGVEALLRWQHPQRGMVSPAQFIPLAEETGLILPIGQWVLETACVQLAAWATDPMLCNLTVAVNVSARQFRQANFVDSVLATLVRTGATAKLLKLELTESMLVDDVEAIIAKMGALKAHGVGFSLDDFGTGYSSLAYLKRLPLNQLKIDQGFVRNIVTDPNDAAIAKMVVVLAESLGLAVIAEGVELQAQVDFLAHLGCHAYQGYLFCKPLPMDMLEVYLHQQFELFDSLDHVEIA